MRVTRPFQQWAFHALRIQALLYQFLRGSFHRRFWQGNQVNHMPVLKRDVLLKIVCPFTMNVKWLIFIQTIDKRYGSVFYSGGIKKAV